MMAVIDRRRAACSTWRRAGKIGVRICSSNHIYLVRLSLYVDVGPIIYNMESWMVGSRTGPVFKNLLS